MPRFPKYAAFGIGGGLIAYLFDRDRGKGRRARLRDQALARFRDAARVLRGRAEYESDRIRGLVHEVTNSPDPVDDNTLRQKIRSEYLGPVRATGADVRVEAGTVLLEGELEDADYQKLVRKISRIPGVKSVTRSTMPSMSDAGDGVTV